MRTAISRLIILISFFIIIQKSVAQDEIGLYKDVLEERILRGKKDQEFLLKQLEEKIENTIFLDNFSNRRYDSIMSSIKLLKSLFIEDKNKEMIEYLISDCNRLNLWMRQTPLDLYEKEISELIIKFNNEKPNGYFLYKKELKEFYDAYHNLIEVVDSEEKSDARSTGTAIFIRVVRHNNFSESKVSLLKNLHRNSNDEKRLEQVLYEINSWDTYVFYYQSFQEMKSKLEYNEELLGDKKYYKMSFGERATTGKKSKEVSAFGQKICQAFLKKDLFMYEGLIASKEKMVERQRRLDGIHAKFISKDERREFDLECEKRYKEIENLYPSKKKKIEERFKALTDSMGKLPNKIKMDNKLEITYGYSEKYINERLSVDISPPTFDIFIPILDSSRKKYVLVLSDAEFIQDDIIFFGVPRFEKK